MIAFILEAVKETGSLFGDISTYVLGTAVLALAGTGIGALAKWIKTLDLVKKLHIESLIDKGAELALHYAESLGRNMTGGDKTDKMNAARESFESHLDKHGIKLDSEAIYRRLEGVFNKKKPEIEAHKSSLKSKV